MCWEAGWAESERERERMWECVREFSVCWEAGWVESARE